MRPSLFRCANPGKSYKNVILAKLNRFTFVLLLLNLTSKFGAWIWNLFLIAQDLHVSRCKWLLVFRLISAIFCILNLEWIFCFHLHILRNNSFIYLFIYFFTEHLITWHLLWCLNGVWSAGTVNPLQSKGLLLSLATSNFSDIKCEKKAFSQLELCGHL